MSAGGAIAQDQALQDAPLEFWGALHWGAALAWRSEDATDILAVYPARHHAEFWQSVQLPQQAEESIGKPHFLEAHGHFVQTDLNSCQAGHGPRYSGQE